MKTFDEAGLAALAAAATRSARRRQNLNLHEQPDDPVQRLLNALEPGTYVRPHRHTTPAKWELFVALRGALAVLTFDDGGVVRRRLDLHPGATVLAEIGAGVWHTLVALQPGSVVLEVKPGPYLQPSDKDFVAWAPEEGTESAVALERWFRDARPGQRAPRFGR